MPKIHRLSLATTYLESFVVRHDGGHELRSFATGFFVEKGSKLYLASNWHVFTGLDPADTTQSHLKGPPHYIKATVRSKDGKTLSALSFPLYSSSWRPQWLEHAEGPAVDLAILEIPSEVRQRYQISIISSLVDQRDINAAISRDVFILGYPFDSASFSQSFSDTEGHHLPIWKRGSIASEPDNPLGGRVILIDSLSRPGMSGSPIVIAEDHDMMASNDGETVRAFQDESLSALERIKRMDISSMRSVRERHFNFLGVYSGVIGMTRGNDVALGKCWTGATLQELLDAPTTGAMPHHGPNGEHIPYQNWVNSFDGDFLFLDRSGEIVERTKLANTASNETAKPSSFGPHAGRLLYQATYVFPKR